MQILFSVMPVMSFSFNWNRFQGSGIRIIWSLQSFYCRQFTHDSKLIDKITYKAKLIGINVKEKEESHTSKIDHLAYEKLKHQEHYLGKRIKRGLFQSSTGKILNADINGGIGIARKVFGDSVISQIIDSGLAFNPVRINIS